MRFGTDDLLRDGSFSHSPVFVDDTFVVRVMMVMLVVVMMAKRVNRFGIIFDSGRRTGRRDLGHSWRRTRESSVTRAPGLR